MCALLWVGYCIHNVRRVCFVCAICYNVLASRRLHFRCIKNYLFWCVLFKCVTLCCSLELLSLRTFSNLSQCFLLFVILFWVVQIALVFYCSNLSIFASRLFYRIWQSHSHVNAIGTQCKATTTHKNTVRHLVVARMLFCSFGSIQLYILSNLFGTTKS